MESACIFASSKYYRQAYADALKISEPLGYNFLSKKQQAPIKKQNGPLIRKLLFDKPLIKAISTKPTPLQKLKQFLLVSDSKRKNTYLSANPLSIINRTSEQICQQLSTKYLPGFQKQKAQTIDFVNTMNNVSDDAFFAINDFALSTYLILYFGKNSQIQSIVSQILDQQFAQYDVKTIRTFRLLNEETIQQKSSIIEFDESHIKNRQKIDQFVKNLHSHGAKNDPMYSGMHLFVGDCISFTSTNEILKQEIENLKYLQFYLYLITNGILGNGQTSLIKVRGTMRHKTIDFLFLFKLIFSKITLIKPAFSNFLSPEKYLFCEGYIAQNGDQVHKFISDNFDLLAQHGQEKLLVNPQLMFRQEALADNTKSFNDSLIVRGLKQVLDIFMKNSNLEIYPPKTALIEKLKSFNFTNGLNGIIDTIEGLVPNQEQIKSQQIEESSKNGNSNNFRDYKSNEPKIVFEQKQASIDIFELLKQTKQQQKPTINQTSSNPKRPKVDQQQQMEGRLLEIFKEQERIKEQKKKLKKQNQKKQKQKKEQDPYLYGGSRFDYAEN